MLKNKKLHIVLLTLAVTILTLICWLITTRINRQLTVHTIRNITGQFGRAAPIIFVALCAGTNIFSPLVIMPLWIGGILAFKFPWSFIYIYTANLLGHSLNFLISRRWGRKIIAKLAGRNSLEKIDQFTSFVGWKWVLLLRLLGGGATDYISYALGLTNIKFVPYIIISAAAFFPWLALNFYLIQDAVNGNLTTLLRNFGILTLLGYLTTILVTLIAYRKHLSETTNQPCPPQETTPPKSEI